MKKQNNIAMGGIFTALSLILLYIASTLPSLRLSFAAAAAVACMILILRAGISTGILVYVATSLLAFLLLPVKSVALFYALCLGAYAIAKYYIESKSHGVLMWLYKLGFATVALGLLYWLGTTLFSLVLPQTGVWMVAFVALGAFVVYDIGLTSLLRLYVSRFQDKW